MSQYFQRIDVGSESPTRWGVFRRHVHGDWRTDEKYNLGSRRWERTLDLQDILSGQRDGDVVEVSAQDIRDFLATKLSAEQVDDVLASSSFGPNHRD